MQEAIAEIILKSEKTRKFVCDYRLKAAIKAMDSLDDELSIHTPNEIIHMDMKNIKLMTMSSVPGIAMRNVCLTIAYKSGINTNVFITEDLAVAVDKQWREKNLKADYICAFDDENLIVLKKKDIEYMTQHVMRFKESALDVPPPTVKKPAPTAYSRNVPVAKVGKFPDKRKAGTYNHNSQNGPKPMAPEKPPVKAKVLILGQQQQQPPVAPVKLNGNIVDRTPKPVETYSGVTANSSPRVLSPKPPATSDNDSLTVKVTIPKKRGRPRKYPIDENSSPKPVVKPQVKQSPAVPTERVKIECTCGAGYFGDKGKDRLYHKCDKCGKTVARDNLRIVHDATGAKVTLFTNYYNPTSLL